MISTSSKFFSAKDFQERSGLCSKGRRWIANCPLVVPLSSERQQTQISNAVRIVTLLKLFKHKKISLLSFHCICRTSAMLLGQEKQNWTRLQWAFRPGNVQMSKNELFETIALAQGRIFLCDKASSESRFSLKSILSFQLCSPVTTTSPCHFLCSLLHLLFETAAPRTFWLQKCLAAAIYLAPYLTNLTVPEILASKRIHSREYHREYRCSNSKRPLILYVFNTVFCLLPSYYAIC